MDDLVVGRNDPKEALERWTRIFWSLVLIQENNECWIWTGTLSDNGYGKIHIDRILYYAHRISFLFHNNKIDPDLVVMHSCDNKRCVNPHHLSQDTQWVNSMDAAIKGRFVRKLSEPDIKKIRHLRESGLSLEKIAAQFGVCHSSINKIVKRKTWAYVD